MDRAPSDIEPAAATPSGAAPSRPDATRHAGHRDPARSSEAGGKRPPGAGPPAGVTEPRQRWRITFARDEIASDRVGRSLLEDWHDALRASSLPFAVQDPESNRPRLAFAAPLPAPARGEAELVDLWLVERMPLWRVREGLADRLPTGHRWVHGEDVWLGAPPLPGQVTAAEWQIGIAPQSGAVAAIAAAARALLAASSVPRTRDKGGSSRTYDLRPLLGDVAVDRDRDRSLRVVTRFDPALGTGRPEEIVAALGDLAGIEIEVRSMVRTRLILNEPVSASKPPAGGVPPARRRRR